MQIRCMGISEIPEKRIIQGTFGFNFDGIPEIYGFVTVNIDGGITIEQTLRCIETELNCMFQEVNKERIRLLNGGIANVEHP